MGTSISGMGPSPAERSSTNSQLHVPAQVTPATHRVTTSPGVVAVDPGSTVHHLRREADAVIGGTLATTGTVRTTAPSRPPHAPRRRRTRPEAPLALQLAAVLGAGVAVAVVVSASALTTVAAVALCLVSGAHARGTAIRPGAPHPGRMVSALAVPLAVMGTFVAFSGGRTGTLRDAAAIVVGCTCADIVGKCAVAR